MQLLLPVANLSSQTYGFQQKNYWKTVKLWKWLQNQKFSGFIIYSSFLGCKLNKWCTDSNALRENQECIWRKRFRENSWIQICKSQLWPALKAILLQFEFIESVYTSSQNLRMIRVGRDLKNPPVSTALS